MGNSQVEERRKASRSPPKRTWWPQAITGNGDFMGISQGFDGSGHYEKGLSKPTYIMYLYMHIISQNVNV